MWLLGWVPLPPWRCKDPLLLEAGPSLAEDPILQGFVSVGDAGRGDHLGDVFLALWRGAAVVTATGLTSAWIQSGLGG